MKIEKKKAVNIKDWLDPLTGVFNREMFANQLHKELQRAVRYNHHVAVLLLGIDGYKKLSEELGNHTGGQILQELSQVLEKNLRTVDIVARHSDDQFIILLPETKKIHAQKIAERILKNLKNYDFFKDNLGIRELNISIGVAGFPEDAGKTEELIKKADHALAQAKQEGGDRVAIYA